MRAGKRAPRAQSVVRPAIVFTAGALLACGSAALRWPADRVRAVELRAARARPRPALERTPRVSILVAAWNEAPLIARHVESVLGMSYPHYEYILCAGGDDGTYEIATRTVASLTASCAAAPKVVILRQHAGEGKQRALQRAFERCAGEIVYLTDADCLADDDSFLRTLAPLIVDGETAATGAFAPLPEQRDNTFVVHQWAVDSYARSLTGDYLEGLIGRNAAVLASAIRECGALGAPVAVGTDYYLARCLLRGGARIRFVGESAVQTHYETDVRRYLRQQARWLKNIVIHGARFGAWSQVRAAGRAYLVGLAAAGLPVLFPVLPRHVAALWAAGVAYTVVNRVRYLAFAAVAAGAEVRRRTIVASLLYGPLDLLMLAYALVELASSRRRQRW